jgi:hypothetical protein
MGTLYLDNAWTVRRPTDEEWLAAATEAEWTELRFVAAVAILVASLTLMTTPVLLSFLAIAEILK